MLQRASEDHLDELQELELEGSGLQSFGYMPVLWPSLLTEGYAVLRSRAAGGSGWGFVC